MAVERVLTETSGVLRNASGIIRASFLVDPLMDESGTGFKMYDNVTKDYYHLFGPSDGSRYVSLTNGSFRPNPKHAGISEWPYLGGYDYFPNAEFGEVGYWYFGLQLTRSGSTFQWKAQVIGRWSYNGATASIDWAGTKTTTGLSPIGRYDMDSATKTPALSGYSTHVDVSGGT